MARIFAYARISTTDRTVENQVREIEAAGFSIEKHRIITETVSGSVSISRRPGFTKLLERMEAGDILIVTKLDRLGRDTIDVMTTVRMLADADIKVHCLALGGIDLTSAAGALTMGVIAAVAQFERDLIVERTQSGLDRAKAAGKVLGRRSTLDEGQKREVLADLDTGMSVSAIARKFKTSRQTILRAKP